MILLIDNYDSFVFNLARYVGELGHAREVVRNDAVTVAEIAALAPEAIILSPGPCTPKEAGISNQVIAELGPRIPILGVCLGHQCIAETYGGLVVRARRPMHGKTSLVAHDGKGVFQGLPDPLRVTRYHSLVAEPSRVPPELEVTALSPEGEIMGLRHRSHPVEGVQFHPEAVLTERGHDLLANFLRQHSAARQSRSGAPGGNSGR
ncbi:MAG TPA: aminodeoxychorismate/anthranilate synthase component II [Methylomirabilota bacterium]|nr:aminodeoxychorismate/anthranilate synthase component II [Methylomirabilota bacterium]